MLDLNRHDMVAISTAKGFQLRQRSQSRRDAHKAHRSATLGAATPTFNESDIWGCF